MWSLFRWRREPDRMAALIDAGTLLISFIFILYRTTTWGHENEHYTSLSTRGARTCVRQSLKHAKARCTSLPISSRLEALILAQSLNLRRKATLTIQQHFILESQM